MDPNANLALLLELANRVLQADGDEPGEASELAELVVALDGWIRNGGAMPQRWTPSVRPPICGGCGMYLEPEETRLCADCAGEECSCCEEGVL